MTEAIRQAIGEYFDKPINESSLFYPAARLVQEEDGKLSYKKIDEAQPIGAKWELILLDFLSPQVCYAHTSYSRNAEFYHEIIVFFQLRSGWKIISVLRAKLSNQYDSLFQSPADESGELSRIGQILHIYCDGVYNLDADSALAVFAPEAHMLHPTDGVSFADVNCNVFRERWAGLPHPSELNLPQFARIYHIELLNASTAVAKVGVAKLNDYFTDYLFCIKTDGEWCIAHKITQVLWKSPEVI